MNSVLHMAAMEEAYNHPREYLLDELIMLDVIIEFEMDRLAAEQQASGTAFHPMKALYLSDADARDLLNNGEEGIRLPKDHELLLEQLDARMQVKAELNRKAGVKLPIHVLQDHFGLNDVERKALFAAVAPHVQRKYLKLYGYIQDDMTCQYVTLDLLLKLCCRSQEERITLFESMTNADSRFKSFFTSANSKLPASDNSLLAEPIRLQPRMVHFLLGLEWRGNGPLASLKLHATSAHASLPPLLLQEGVYQSIVQYVDAHPRNGLMLWGLYGPSGSGKTLQALRACACWNRPLLEFDLSQAPESRDEFLETLDLLLLEAVLQQAAIAVDRLHKLAAPQQDAGLLDHRLGWLLERLASWNDIVFLLSHEEIKLSSQHGSLPFISIHLQLPDIGESSRLWSIMANGWRELSGAEAQRLAGKFKFTPGQIASTVLAAKQLEEWYEAKASNKSEPVNTSAAAPVLLSQAAYQIINHGLQQKAVKVEPKFGWDDLILPNDTIALLRQACNRIKDRHTVMHSWGFDRVLPYGKGISMMFTGPPGTGKTMSALVMAREMEAELYRVDLSRVVSKYIGETEKNLSEIFDHARLSGAILFFDEADALFGKRSEVKDAHDKYANMETSYLLQKMEEYDGLTILATNFAQNLDDAFMRRIQFIVKFPFPDAAQREQLWRSAIPKAAPAEDIDYSFLAQTFELSGGPIKNIILTAAYLAANEDSPLSMKHMVEGAIQEYKKTGKVLLKDRLGPYSEYWKG